MQLSCPTQDTMDVQGSESWKISNPDGQDSSMGFRGVLSGKVRAFWM